MRTGWKCYWGPSEMIGLSAPLYDPAGSLRIDEMAASEINDLARRVNRIRTLDGGVSVNDTGHVAGDRNFRLRWRVPSAAQYEAVQRLVRLYPRLTVTTREGVFIAAPESVRMRDGQGDLQLLVLEQIT